MWNHTLENVKQVGRFNYFFFLFLEWEKNQCENNFNSCDHISSLQLFVLDARISSVFNTIEKFSDSKLRS